METGEILLGISIALIAGLISNRLIKLINLPNVTGYLIVGILLGPYFFSLFNSNLTAQNLQQHINITDKMYISFADTFEWPINTENKEKNSIKFCYGLRSHFGILCDGTVVACCLDNEGKLVSYKKVLLVLLY